MIRTSLWGFDLQFQSTVNYVVEIGWTGRWMIYRYVRIMNWVALLRLSVLDGLNFEKKVRLARHQLSTWRVFHYDHQYPLSGQDLPQLIDRGPDPLTPRSLPQYFQDPGQLRHVLWSDDEANSPELNASQR